MGARSAAVLTVMVALLVPVVATASACEICKQANQSVLVLGKSPNGVPWRITTVGPRTDSFGRRGVVFHFDFGPPAYYDSGYDTGMGLPVPAGFAVTGVPGSDLSPYPESDLSGITGRGVTGLAVAMNDGSQLEIRPQPARPVLRDRYPWLRRLRFYDAFYSAAIRPLSVSALDFQGAVVARASLAHGAFSAARAD